MLSNDYFTLKLPTHQHQTINNPNTAYSTLKGFLELPKFNSKSGKNSIKSSCALNWNSILGEHSIKFLLKYWSDENWLENTKIYVLKKLLKEHFLSNYLWKMNLNNLFQSQIFFSLFIVKLISIIWLFGTLILIEFCQFSPLIL